MLEKASEYLGTEPSYEKTVKSTVYDDRHVEAERDAADRQQPVGLAPSTVWRWLSWLGGMPATLRAAWNLIRQKEPNATLHRQPWAVSPRKYRSQKRHDTLIAAMQLLAVDRVCAGLFGAGIFPRYAISQGFS